MIRLIGATVDEVLAVGGGLRLLGCGLRLIRLRRRVGGGGRSLVGGGLSGLGRIMRLDGRVRRVGRGLVGHRDPRRPVPPFRRVRTIRRVNPQCRGLAHRRIRRSALDEHVGLAVRHASGGGGSGIRFPCGGGRVGRGLGRAVGGGLGLGRDARSVGGGGLGMGRVGLRGGGVRFGGSRVGLRRIGRSVGGVRQCLRVASGLLGAFGGGLRRIGGILGLTGGRGRALCRGVRRVGGGLGRACGALRAVCRALRVFRCCGGVLGSLLGVGGLRRIVRDIRLRPLDLLRIVLHIGITHVVPIRAIPHQRIDHAIGQRDKHAW